jgi:hypothetical protein
MELVVVTNNFGRGGGGFVFSVVEIVGSARRLFSST